MAEVPMPMPWWKSVLDLAEKWGKPPWEIIERRPRLIWVLREQITTQVIQQAELEKSKHK